MWWGGEGEDNVKCNLVFNATLLGRERERRTEIMWRKGQAAALLSSEMHCRPSQKTQSIFVRWILMVQIQLPTATATCVGMHLFLPHQQLLILRSGSRNLIFLPNADCSKSNSMCISYSFYDLSSVLLLLLSSYFWRRKELEKMFWVYKYKPVHGAVKGANDWWIETQH